MARRRPQPRATGFTLVEMLVVVAVAALLLSLAAPSFFEMITMQRLRNTSSQIVTDMQFARSEAVARRRIVRVNLGFDGNQTCYTIYWAASNAVARCDCKLGAGAACTAGASQEEIRTVSVPRSSQVTLEWPDDQDTAFGYDPVTGGLVSIPSDEVSAPLALVVIDAKVDADRLLRTNIIQTGRPAVCAPNAAVMKVPGC